MFDPSQQYGVLKPVGFFDPLGLSKGISEEKFFRWREIEIKHGRVCMVAFIGCKYLLFPPFVVLPACLPACLSTASPVLPHSHLNVGALPSLHYLEKIRFFAPT